MANSWLERPNLISILILVVVVLLAGGYGFVTYTQRPEMNSFDVDEDYAFDFDFSRASRIVDLPKDLEEISGLTAWTRPNEVLAVQDEDGELFVVDVSTGKITLNFKFGKDRDYEGIARDNDSIYVLEKDGDIHWIQYRDSLTEYDAEKLETSFSYRNDTEGICFDDRTGTLLIVPKEQELNPGDDADNRRGIYTYDLQRRELTPQPTYYIDEFEVGEAIYGKQSRYRIKPSGVAVDPITGDIYVVASVGNILVVIDRESNLKHIELLDEDIFKQPEGITFNEDGDLFISSEGRGGKGIVATLLRSRREAITDEPTATEANANE